MHVFRSCLYAGFVLYYCSCNCMKRKINYWIHYENKQMRDERTKVVTGGKRVYRPRGYKTFFILTLIEHEILTARKNLNTDK